MSLISADEWDELQAEIERLRADPMMILAIDALAALGVFLGFLCLIAIGMICVSKFEAWLQTWEPRSQ